MSRRKPIPKAFRARGGTRVMTTEGEVAYPAPWWERQDGVRAGTYKGLHAAGHLPDVTVHPRGGLFLTNRQAALALDAVREFAPGAWQRFE